MRLIHRPGISEGFWTYIEDAGKFYLLYCKTVFGHKTLKVREVPDFNPRHADGFYMDKVMDLLENSQILADPFAFEMNRYGQREAKVCTLKELNKPSAAKPKRGKGK